MVNAIQLTDRSNLPHAHLKQLRKKGHIPAVIYGTQLKGLPVEVNGKELQTVLKRDPRAILQATIPNHGKHPVLVQAVQKDKVTNEWIHIDFLQIDMNEKLVTKASIIYTGTPIGTKEGGIVQVELQEVEIRCMPDKLISAYEVDISGLVVGNQVFVSDLPVNDGVEILTDPAIMLVNILAPKVAEVEQPVEA